MGSLRHAGSEQDCGLVGTVRGGGWGLPAKSALRGPWKGGLAGLQAATTRPLTPDPLPALLSRTHWWQGLEVARENESGCPSSQWPSAGLSAGVCVCVTDRIQHGAAADPPRLPLGLPRPEGPAL